MELKITERRHNRLAKNKRLWKFIERCGIKGSFETDWNFDKEANSEILTIRSIIGISMPTENNNLCEVLHD